MASITFGRSAELIPQFNTYAPIGVAPLIPPRPSSGAKGTIISLNTPPKSWEIDYDELRVENELGRGAFGIVYKGKWRGGWVAVKILISTLDKLQLEEFEAEAAVMKYGGECIDFSRNIRPHTNVVQLQGICHAPGKPLAIVTEFCEKGSLASYLSKISPSQLSFRMKLEIIKGIASGLLHLHLEGIVHRDLAARNVLLSGNFVPKVSDFGMSRVLSTEKESSNVTNKEVGPLKWMAPESLLHRVYSSKTDMYSFGVTLFEVLTHKEPYSGMNAVQVATMMGARQLNLLTFLPADIEYNDDLLNILQRCLQWAPEDRPETRLLVDLLEAIEQQQQNV